MTMIESLAQLIQASTLQDFVVAFVASLIAIITTLKLPIVLFKLIELPRKNNEFMLTIASAEVMSEDIKFIAKDHLNRYIFGRVSKIKTTNEKMDKLINLYKEQCGLFSWKDFKRIMPYFCFNEQHITVSFSPLLTWRFRLIFLVNGVIFAMCTFIIFFALLEHHQTKDYARLGEKSALYIIGMSYSFFLSYLNLGYWDAKKLKRNMDERESVSSSKEIEHAKNPDIPV